MKMVLWDYIARVGFLRHQPSFFVLNEFKGIMINYACEVIFFLLTTQEEETYWREAKKIELKLVLLSSILLEHKNRSIWFFILFGSNRGSMVLLKRKQACIKQADLKICAERSLRDRTLFVFITCKAIYTTREEPEIENRGTERLWIIHGGEGLRGNVDVVFWPEKSIQSIKSWRD